MDTELIPINDMEFDYCTPPGESVAEAIEYLHMSKRELAERTGLSTSNISKLLVGKYPLTQDTAEKLEYATGINQSFLMRMENEYRSFLKKKEERKREYRDFLTGFPYRDLVEAGFCRDTQVQAEQREGLLRFFGVADERAYAATYTARIEGAARAGYARSWQMKPFSAWLRVGEIIARESETAPFSVDKLKRGAASIRKLAGKSPIEVWGEVQRILADCGVVAIVQKPFEGCSIFGLTRFISKDRAILQLSCRMHRVGTFWFSLFHGIAHLLKHEKKAIFINEKREEPGFREDRADALVAQECDSGEDRTDAREREADEMARDTLIAPEKWKEFTSHLSEKEAIEMIRAFAAKENICADVVVGRLQQEKPAACLHVALNSLTETIKEDDFPVTPVPVR